MKKLYNCQNKLFTEDLKLNIRSTLITILLLLILSSPFTLRAGTFYLSLPETDTIKFDDSIRGVSFYVFDLRDRETYIQFTPAFNHSLPTLVHVQIFDVSNNCNENNFFDNYTLNDTHVYNMRDIKTNDANPSGVVLPENSYGIVAINARCLFEGGPSSCGGGIGSIRILDNNGYEYRTNGVMNGFEGDFDSITENMFHTFNFSSNGGVTLSDIIGVTLALRGAEGQILSPEMVALPPQEIFSPFDVDIFDTNEVPFSCRDVVFACVDDSNPQLEELLEVSGINVASFEYGINEAVPHSKGGELLCPGNNIPEGFVRLTPQAQPLIDDPLFFAGFVGLNNGNGRGSMDSIWTFNYPEQGLSVQ